MDNRKKKFLKMRENGMSLAAIGKVFDISKQRVYQIISGRTQNNKLEIRLLFQSIKERDQFTCQKCGTQAKKLLVHHLDCNPENNMRTNLLSLCTPCHTYLHRKGYIAIENNRLKSIIPIRKAVIRDRSLMIRLPKNLHDKFQAYAEANNTTMSHIVQKFIKKYINKNK